MMLEIEKYLCIFFIYSFLGWFMESFGGYLRFKKWVNRGFLIGPYCPVYGIGVVLLTAFLSKYVNDLPIMFFMSILICGSLEYFTSYIMEKLFNARWWDYHNRKFNINGRICLETLVPFGVVGTVLVKYANTFFLGIFSKITILNWILPIICILFVIDFIFSFKIILRFRNTAKQVEKEIKNNEVKDNTEEIVKHVKEKVVEIQDATTQKINNTIGNAKQSLHNINRNLTVTYKVFKRNIKFTGKKFYSTIMKSTEKFKKKLNIQITPPKTDFNKIIKERLSSKWSTRRLLKAFPSLEIKFKNKNDNDNNK